MEFPEKEMDVSKLRWCGDDLDDCMKEVHENRMRWYGDEPKNFAISDLDQT